MCVYVYTHCMLVMAACARERCSLCLAGDGAVGMSVWDSVPCRRAMACPWGPWPLRHPALSLREPPARGKGRGPSREVTSVGIHGPRGPWRGRDGASIPPHLAAQLSLGAAWVSPQGRGRGGTSPESLGRLQRYLRPGLRNYAGQPCFWAGRDHHPGGRRSAGEHGRSRAHG